MADKPRATAARLGTLHLDADVAEERLEPVLDGNGIDLELLRPDRADDADGAPAEAAGLGPRMVVLKMKVAAVKLIELWKEGRRERAVIEPGTILLGINDNDIMLVENLRIIIKAGPVW